MSNDKHAKSHKKDDAKDDAPETFGAATDAPGSNPDPTRVPDHNDGLIVTGGTSPTDGAAKVASAAKGEPTAGLSFDAPPADAPVIPHADPVPGDPHTTKTKDSSANAHQLDTITVHGWVDMPVMLPDGTFDARHVMGPVQIPNPRIHRPDGTPTGADAKPADKHAK